MRVPDNEHGVIASVRRDNPLLVLRAQDRCDLVAMTLKELLLLRHIVVNDTGVSGRVEDLGPVVIGQEVHSLVDVLIESNDPLQILQKRGFSYYIYCLKSS